MKSRSLSVLSARHPVRVRSSLPLAVLVGHLVPVAPFAQREGAGAASTAPSRLASPINEHSLVTLKASVRRHLASSQQHLLPSHHRAKEAIKS